MPLRDAIKSLVDQLPGPVAEQLLVGVRRASNPAVRRMLRERARYLAELGNPDRVLSGPFKGARYRSSPVVTDVLPKVLGTYEMELHPAVEQIVRLGPDAIVNVGSAEGYYSVGLGLLVPGARLICFEIRRPIRNLLARALQSNGLLDRSELHGAGSPETLQAALAGFKRPLVLSDCEGYEDILLDPQRVPALRKAAILVETHEMFAPGSAQRIRERFAPTHDIQSFATRPRTDADAPRIPGVSIETLRACMDEDRADPQVWYYIAPKAAA